MVGTTKNPDGKTTHRCITCGKRFEGTQKRGRPYLRCPECRAALAAKKAARLTK
jgi:DNA-directed RNA polymerase subunit RPC12/RpoP